MMALPGQWNGVEPVLADGISEELEGPVPPGPGGRGHHEHCCRQEAVGTTCGLLPRRRNMDASKKVVD